MVADTMRRGIVDGDEGKLDVEVGKQAKGFEAAKVRRWPGQ
jgi:hypothetical protein